MKWSDEVTGIGEQSCLSKNINFLLGNFIDSQDCCFSTGKQLKVLVNAAENYHAVLAENKKLFNEVQELKG